MLPIVLIALAYVLGIVGGLYIFCIAPFFLILCLLFIKKKKGLILICTLFFALGIFITVCRLNQYDNRYQNGVIKMEATIISDLIEKDKVYSYIAKNNRGDKFIIYMNKGSLLEYGMKIQLSGDLELPSFSRNRRRI